MKDPACMVLLNHGASKELVDRKGRTPLKGLKDTKRDDEKFRRSMGLDRMQKTAAMLANQAREEEKFAQCLQLLNAA